MPASPDRGITLHYRGLTLRMEEGDPRIVVLDYLLFRDLPPPVERPTQPEPPPAPTPPAAPSVQVPDAWHVFWGLLPDGARRILAELSRRELTTPELETVLGMAPGTTRGFTVAIAHNAKKAGLGNPMRGARFGREKRRHYVAHDARDVVLELERRWLSVRAALQAARQ